MVQEEWRKIDGYDEWYEVSNLGNVRSLDHQITKSNGVRLSLKGKILKPSKQGQVKIGGKTVQVSELLESAFPKSVELLTVKTKKTSVRSECLDKAKKCVCGKREQDYGSPEDNFKMIANLWNDYLQEKQKIDAGDVAIMMALLKIARISTGTGTEDCFVDLAGYAACAAEIHTKGDKSNETGTDESNQ